MSAGFRIPENFIWLSSAVDIVAERLLPQQWASAICSDEERAEVEAYGTAMAAWRDRSQPLGSLAELAERAQFGGLATLKPSYSAIDEEPQKSQLYELAEMRMDLRRQCRNHGWQEWLRPRLMDGRLNVSCAISLKPNLQVSSEAWWKPENDGAHERNEVYTGLDDAGKLIRGKPYLERSALFSELEGQPTDAAEPQVKMPASEVTVDRPAVGAPNLNASLANMKRALKLAENFMSSRKYRRLTKTEAELSIVGDIFSGVSRDLIRDKVTGKNYPTGKRVSPKLLANREREIADCRSAVEAAIIDHKMKRKQ